MGIKTAALQSLLSYRNFSKLVTPVSGRQSTGTAQPNSCNRRIIKKDRWIMEVFFLELGFHPWRSYNRNMPSSLHPRNSLRWFSRTQTEISSYSPKLKKMSIVSFTHYQPYRYKQFLFFHISQSEATDGRTPTLTFREKSLPVSRPMKSPPSTPQQLQQGGLWNTRRQVAMTPLE